MKTTGFKSINKDKNKEKRRKQKKMFCTSLESAQENDSTEKSCVLHTF